ncbi:hypothetical protein FMUND_15124 [Fusarium mundagurra]|uniref:Uncharacterized protein n=1 Tax=Fusarium mundagurra TaxID=1567541 RepID=A0A8H6D015_9HYPO|nr:hypothetical protein FMUND_15124 [Fusarium mundagurra]
MAHVPSKATILVCSGDHASEDPPHRDAKVTTVNRPQPLRLAFSRNFITQVKTCLVHRCFILRHRNASSCPINKTCRHWELLKMTEWFLNEEEDVVDLRVNGVTKELVAKGCTGRLEGVVMFDDEENEGDKITSQPSDIFSALKPDFGAIERMGCYVLDWYICKGRGEWETMRGRRMDVFGRPVK